MPKKHLEVNDLAKWSIRNLQKFDWEGGTLYSSYEIWAHGVSAASVLRATFTVNTAGLLLVLETRIFAYTDPENEYPDEQVVKVLDLTSNQVGWCAADLLNKWPRNKKK